MTRNDKVTEVTCDKCGKLISVEGEYIHTMNTYFTSYRIGDSVDHVDNHLDSFMGCSLDLCTSCYPNTLSELDEVVGDNPDVWYGRDDEGDIVLEPEESEGVHA